MDMVFKIVLLGLAVSLGVFSLNLVLGALSKRGKVDSNYIQRELQPFSNRIRPKWVSFALGVSLGGTVLVALIGVYFGKPETPTSYRGYLAVALVYVSLLEVGGVFRFIRPSRIGKLIAILCGALGPAIIVWAYYSIQRVPVAVLMVAMLWIFVWAPVFYLLHMQARVPGRKDVN